MARIGRNRVGSGTLDRMSETQPATSFEVECPHCHKPFTAEPIEGSAARYRGFKCPHCRLFVPYERAAGAEPPEPLDG